MKYHSRHCSRSSIMKAFLIVIVTVTITSVLWAIMKNALDPNITHENVPARVYRKEGKWPTLDGTPDRIFWMVQMSDIHISKFRDLKRGPDLIQFCKDYLQVIQPPLVILTGDLTDSKAVDDSTSYQFEEEWQTYHAAIQQCKTMTSATILDIRGNHDAFDVSEVNGKDNLYRKYSEMGTKHSLSYHHQHVTPFGRYSFIAVDACPIPGPRRPFNFFGHLDDDRVQQLVDLDMESQGSNLTLWFGHYPSSIIVQDPPGIRHIMRNGVAYLCGHLHTLGNWVPKMYSRQKTGALELELGDWKDNRKFRVLAIDHDMLSFVDAQLGEWPLVLVTNPKDAQFLAPYHEPTESIRQSTHIRVLVFSQKAVTSVEIYIDDQYMGKAQQTKGPLYTLPWTPWSFSSGLHTLRVHVKEEAGLEKSVEQSFSVDGSTPGFAFWPRFILMLNVYTVSKVVFGCMVFMYVLLLTSLRQCSTIRSFQFSGDNCLSRTWNSWIYRLWLVARTNSIYYTLLGFLLYITFGPWFMGEFVTGYTGVLFVWGTFVKGTFLPGSLAYIYGVFQMLTFNGPLTLLLGSRLDIRHPQTSSATIRIGSQGQSRWPMILSNLLFSLLLCFQTFIALTEFPRNYGTTALIMSPMRVGSVFVAILLLYFVSTAPIRRMCAVNGTTNNK